MLKDVNRLKKRKEFAYLYNNGTAKHSEHLTLVYLPTKHRPLKVGFSISKKIGKAHIPSNFVLSPHHHYTTTPSIVGE